jgi:uncharacterized protein related to proFAR isomerase
MKLIPAISIKGGHVATVENGQYSYLKNADGQFRSPVNLVKELDLLVGEVFILDIDGLEKNNPDLETVKRIAAFRDVWLDAGTTDAESMMDLFVSDASRVVMGTLTLDSLDELRMGLEMSENIIFSIAYDRGIVSPNPSVSGIDIETLLKEIGEFPTLQTGMLFDLGGLRDRTPPDPDIVSKFAGHFKEFYVSGHIPGTIIDALENSGVSGLIIDFRTMEARMHDGT